ncbi:MAG: TraB/GumN family protein [Bacteroidota bacterium]|nr:TraB/GumN family protein [Bacteroidota bacterium]
MKKSIVLLIGFFFFISNSFSQQDVDENFLLWEISGNGLEQPSYLYGTIHIIPSDDFFFYNSWKEKLLTCKYLVLETDVKPSILKQLSLLKMMKLPKDSTLNNYMAKDEQLAYQHYILDSLNISPSIYNITLKYKPFFSYSLILNDLIKSEKKYYEMYLSDLAKKNKIKSRYLETLKFQMSLVSGISIVEQIDMFLFDYGIEKQANIVADFHKMVDYYKNQDLIQIAIIENSDENDDFYDKFLINRNKDWISKIIYFIEKKPTFVAVGAAHLVGKEGVIQLLRKEGYTMKPVVGK